MPKYNLTTKIYLELKIEVKGGYVPISTGEAWLKMKQLIGTEIHNKIGILNNIIKIQRHPICGNNICEFNERPIITIQNENTTIIINKGCNIDCPFIFKECPYGRIEDGHDPQFCSGHGICHTGSGVCSCAYGYTSFDCSECIDTFIRYYNIFF